MRRRLEDRDSERCVLCRGRAALRAPRRHAAGEGLPLQGQQRHARPERVRRRGVRVVPPGVQHNVGQAVAGEVAGLGGAAREHEARGVDAAGAGLRAQVALDAARKGRGEERGGGGPKHAAQRTLASRRGATAWSLASGAGRPSTPRTWSCPASVVAQSTRRRRRSPAAPPACAARAAPCLRRRRRPREPGPAAGSCGAARAGTRRPPPPRAPPAPRLGRSPRGQRQATARA